MRQVFKIQIDSGSKATMKIMHMEKSAEKYTLPHLNLNIICSIVCLKLNESETEITLA